MVWVPRSSAIFGFVPRATVGASLEERTVIVKVLASEVLSPPPLSCAVTVTVAVPKRSVAGVKVSLPLPSIAGCAENKALLLFVTLNVKV